MPANENGHWCPHLNFRDKPHCQPEGPLSPRLIVKETLLAFSQRFVAFLLERAEMYEKIITVGLLNEAEAFLSLNHLTVPLSVSLMVDLKIPDLLPKPALHTVFLRKHCF